MCLCEEWPFISELCLYPPLLFLEAGRNTEDYRVSSLEKNQFIRATDPFKGTVLYRVFIYRGTIRRRADDIVTA
jgi:hypothetical protein